MPITIFNSLMMCVTELFKLLYVLMWQGLFGTH